MKRNEVKSILKKQILLIKPSLDVENKIKELGGSISDDLKRQLKEKKLNAQVFIGGSLAKGTLVKKDIYDVDIFVRFDKSYEDNKISSLLNELLCNKARLVHGSRDYYQMGIDGVLIEIIPVRKISKPEDSVNVTDLSYFHVNYVVNKIKKNKILADEIRLAKCFAHAHNCYGAESYIRGFSGYALELLVLHFESFIEFVEWVAGLDCTSDKPIIDDSNFFKNSEDVLKNLNISKRISPIILIDPTYKDRNALSSLSHETFFKFQNSCRNFLEKPSLDSFEKKDVSNSFVNFKNTKKILVGTNKQAGDIAGSKSRKFYRFFLSKLKKEFLIKKSDFDYNDNDNLAYFYFILGKKRGETIKGPPITSLNNFKNFKKVHPLSYVKNGYAYVKKDHHLIFENWFKNFLREYERIINEMGIRRIELV